MDYKEIMDELKKKIYKPVYLLQGEEPYFIDKITNYIQENVLSEAERSFNQTILYGKDTTVEEIINTAKRFPMMSNLQVVIVKEAQNLKNINELRHYVKNPQQSTLLVINYKYKSLDKRKKLYKDAKKKAVVFDSTKIKDYKLPAWITKYIESKNKKITSDASVLLAEYLGNDLNKIAHELDKLFITLPQSETTITPGHIEKNIGISKDYNAFELNKALADKDVLKANRIINHFGKNPNEHPMPKVIGSLYYFFSKVLGYHFLDEKTKKDKYAAASQLRLYPNMVWQYQNAAKKYNRSKLARIIGYLREYDMKSKGLNNTSTPSGELLQELIFKILH
jgi:DNA polymerase-3 subunit delta